NPGNGQSFGSSVSTDGRYVAFTSSASNLPGPDDSQQYVYVRDRQSGNTEVINIYPAYYQFAVFSGNSNPIISADGIYVIFDYVTFHTCFNLPRCHDIYVYNRQTGNFSRVNTLNLGTPATNMSISGDGRYI